MASEARAKVTTGAGSRDAILSRIRQALATPAQHQPDMTPIATDRIFAPVQPQEMTERFVKEAVVNLMEVVRPQNPQASTQALAEIIGALPAGEVSIEDSPVLRTLASSLPPTRTVRWTTDGPPAESAQATVTTAEALVAQTGSILACSAPAGRGASVIAPVHIVYAKTSQIVPELEAALDLVHQRGLYDKASYVGLISGSSRTADIEKILVQGAHGPRRLVLILESD
jgi:L-lactate dehydrogenase complex protein LldG